MCCSPWDHKELDMTEQLNNNKTESCSLPSCYFSLRHIKFGAPTKGVPIFMLAKPISFLNNFYWRIVALQCCVSSCCTESASYMYTYILFFFGFPSHLGYCRALSIEFPSLYSRFSLVIHPFLFLKKFQFSSVQSLGRVRLFATP